MGANHSKHNILRKEAGCFIRSENREAAAEAERRLFRNDSGDAVVEAAILFPIMTMVFAALVLLAVYLPSQAVLQQSTQYAATALAAEISDTWLFFDDGSMSYYREKEKNRLANVYSALFERNDAAMGLKGETITTKMESRSISSKAGELDITLNVRDKVIYKEITVEASRKYPMPVDLSFIGFPKTLTVTAASTAVVQNGDEFVRNVDLATDFAQYAAEKFGLGDIGASIGGFGGQVKALLGW